MAGRKRRIAHSADTKIAAVEMLNSGAKHREVLAKYGIVSSLLHAWRKQYMAGKFGKPKGQATAKVQATRTEHLTPEVLFQDRVQRAITLLRQAEKEVERLKLEKKILEADTAHLHAQLALRLLQGDNGR